MPSVNRPAGLQANLKANQDLARAQMLERNGDIRGAIAIYRKYLKAQPNEPMLLFAEGNAMAHLGDTVRGRRQVEKAIRLSPSPPSLFYQTHALLSLSMGETDAALASIDRALAMEPGSVEYARAKADVLRAAGRHEEARELLRPHIEAGTPVPIARMVYSKLCAHLGDHDEARRVIEPTAADESIDERDRAAALFQLGDLQDKAKEHQAAFGSWSQGNEIRARYADPPFNPEKFEQAVRTMAEAWNPDRLAALPRARVHSEVPLFIVGMPRSGTTLTETILGAHPRITPGGEMKTVPMAVPDLQAPDRQHPTPAQKLDSVTQGLVDRVARRTLRDFTSVDRKASRVTDKLPQNFLRLGLIEIMFPNARVIHCRRNPLDTLVSCFAQDFHGAAGQTWSHALEHMGLYYRGYLRLMDHWRSVLSIPILEVDYELMVSDQEAQSRRLVDFAGLEWDDACLNFHESTRTVVTQSSEQVRKKMYSSSVSRSDRYGALLDPLRAALETPGSA